MLCSSTPGQTAPTHLTTSVRPQVLSKNELGSAIGGSKLIPDRPGQSRTRANEGLPEDTRAMKRGLSIVQ
jgi:hypothetical protein